MPRKRAAKPVITMVPHRSPQLAQLLEAAKTCRIEAVRRFLAAGGLPDTLVELKHHDGESIVAPMIFQAISTHQIAQDTALHHASLELLLQAGANADAICIDAKGQEHTTLMAACKVPCCTAPVRLLLAHGANPALQTSAGEVALHIAASVGQADVCRLLLKAGCEPAVSDCKGMTPLLCAVHQGHVQVVELLHRQWGADLSITHSDGDKVLHIAAASGSPDMLEYLLRNGLDVNAVTSRGATPVCVAALKQKLAAVQTLLDHGASTLAVDGQGNSLLMVAVRQGFSNVVELLLSLHNNGQAAVDVNATTADGNTALHIAACKDRIAMVAALLQHGAAVNALHKKTLTPLALAAGCASAELVQLLLDAGAELTGPVSVLHSALANASRPEVLKLMLEQSGAAAMVDVLAVECDCCGPRTAVMSCDQPEHLKLLLAAGADVHITTNRGDTALHVAAVHKYPAPVMCLLIKAGVDLHAVNNDGKTAAC
jgi:ankyrin repeat protein